MTRGGLPALTELEIADDPDLWRRLGFAVQPGDLITAGSVTLRLVGEGAGERIVSWTLRSAAELPTSIDGIVTRRIPADPGSDDDEAPTRSTPVNPNGVSHLDHVVVTTPDLSRTLEALESAGMELRRTREAGTPEQPMRQAFLWAGDVLVEVAGPAESSGRGPAKLWGLVAVTGSLDLLAEQAGALIGPARPAVQEGRLIAPLSRAAGSSIAVAFMTPHVRRARSVS